MKYDITCIGFMLTDILYEQIKDQQKRLFQQFGQWLCHVVIRIRRLARADSPSIYRCQLVMTLQDGQVMDLIASHKQVGYAVWNAFIMGERQLQQQSVPPSSNGHRLRYC